MEFRGKKNGSVAPTGDPLSARGHFETLEKEAAGRFQAGDREVQARLAVEQGIDLSGRPLVFVGAKPRMIAFGIDFVICVLLFFTCVLFYGVAAGYGIDITEVFHEFAHPVPGRPINAFGYLVFVALACWLYAPLMISSTTQATFGMKAVGARIVDLNLNTLDVGNALWRQIVFSFLFITGFGLLANWLRIEDGARKQGFHDSSVDCICIKD
jgi:uncharacterized RDD family membrane protein YckC